MAVNPDFANMAQITFREPSKGSCIPPGFLAELAQLMVIQIPPSSNTLVPCISTQPDNLASLDASKCVYVPAVIQFDDQQNWLQSTPADLVFSGWAAALDATVAQLTITLTVASGETAVVSANVVTRTATQVVVRVAGAANDVGVQLTLVQNPVPPANA